MHFPEGSTTSIGLVAVTGILFPIQNCYIIVFSLFREPLSL